MNKKKNLKIKAPQFPKKLSGTFWGITTFFNSANYKNKMDNYRIFRDSSKKQGLKLLTIELAFGKQTFKLSKNDADILIQVRSNSVLWQKERLFNIGLKNLPRDCDKVALLDADIIFENNEWIRETSRLLEKYIAVQPFKKVLRLGKKKNTIEKEYYSATYGFLFENKNKTLETGYACAFRKKTIENIGIYDKMIIGGGDKIMFLSICNKKKLINNFLKEIGIEGLFKRDILNWSKIINSYFRESVYYTNGVIKHLYHGDKKNRLYYFRNKILSIYNFNPKKDIKLNKYGCWEWATKKQGLHKRVKNYFKLRNEQGRVLKNILVYIKYQKVFLNDLDYFIGLIGIYLRRVSPKPYNFFKRNKKRL